MLSKPISDHFSICLVPEGIIWDPTPFRLENKWLKVAGFRPLVEKCWKEAAVEGTANFKFAYKLKYLKNAIKCWARQEEGRTERIIKEYFVELDDLDNKEMGGH